MSLSEKLLLFMLLYEKIIALSSKLGLMASLGFKSPLLGHMQLDI
jgi:hypothetical protein